ncbi:MAG: MarR family transcriptional regulator [Chloroflexi bacterium]|nr:MarR family transcriptional regulator [Chloroflexota bacterium]
MTKLLEACAHELMDTAPQIVQAIRVEMRRGRGSDLSIPQFRSLAFIQRNPDSSLSDVAEHLGLTLPSVSKLVDGLVKQKLVSRLASTTDRRRLILALTQAGTAIMNSSRAAAQAELAAKISSLSGAELETVCKAMQLLRPVFVNKGR